MDCGVGVAENACSVATFYEEMEISCLYKAGIAEYKAYLVTKE